jgi:hypothetical protein
VHGAKERRYVGSEYMGAQASQNAVFVVVDYSIENVGRETDTVMSDDFVLESEDGRRYQPSSKATTALAMSGSSDYILSQLQPGIATRAKTAFEVPNTDAALRLVIPQKGFGFGKMTVSLKIEGRRSFDPPPPPAAAKPSVPKAVAAKK